MAPVNTPSGLNRRHNITKADGYHFENGEVIREVIKGDLEKNMFTNYIQNPEVDTFDMVAVVIRNDRCNPIAEYLVSLTTGFLGASLWGQTTNPFIVQDKQVAFDAYFNP